MAPAATGGKKQKKKWSKGKGMQIPTTTPTPIAQHPDIPHPRARSNTADSTQ
jgi:hypothetical protein